VAPAAEELAAELRQVGRRLAAGLRSRATTARARLDALSRHAAFRRPFQQVFELGRRLDEIDARLLRAMRGQCRLTRRRLDASAGRLESLSPLAVLSRGYSLTQRPDGRLVRSACELAPGDEIVTRFAQGRAASRIERILDD